jgi:hypothetical protein
MSKNLLLKLLDSGMFKFSQPTTWTSIAQILSGITYFESHNHIIKSGSAIIILIASLYNWVRNEITKADLINDVK